MMDNKTMMMITKFLTDEGLSPEHVQYAADRKFSDEAMKELAKKCELSNLETTELVSTVKGMREGTQRVNAPVLSENTERKPWVIPDTEFLIGVCVFVGALIMMLLLFSTCRGIDALKTDMTTLKTDVASIKTAVTAEDGDGNPVTAMDVVRDIRTNMVKAADLTNLAKSSDLDGLSKKSDLDGLAKKGDLSDLAKKSDLDGLAKTKHLRRVERKVDRLLIAHEADEENEAPVAEVEKEPAPTGNGTVHVVIRRIPVDDDE